MGVGLISPHALLLHPTSVSVLHLPNGNLTTSLVTSDYLLLSMSINSVVAVLLDCQNNLSVHLLSTLTSSTSSTPIASFQLPMAPCPYSSPRVAISDMAIAAAAMGSNRVIVYQLWSGLPVANAKSNVEKEENEKKVEAQGVMEDDGQGEVGHGDDGQEDDGQGDVGQGEV